MGIVLMKPTDPDWGARGITVSGALPSQLTFSCSEESRAWSADTMGEACTIHVRVDSVLLVPLNGRISLSKQQISPRCKEALLGPVAFPVA